MPREGISNPLGEGIKEGFPDDMVTSQLSLVGNVKAK